MHNIYTTPVERAKQDFPYLDRCNGVSRGDGTEQRAVLDIEALNRLFDKAVEDGKVHAEIDKVYICKRTYAKFTDIPTGTKTAYQQLRCNKWWCPDCGGINGRIHQDRYLSVIKRIGVEEYFARQFVFTIPDNLRTCFKSKKMLNSLFALVQRLIEREFGQYVGEKRDKNGRMKEKQYRLTKPVVAYLHVDGKELDIFNPHINVHIFEKHGQKRRLSPARLSGIQQSYRKALSHLLRTAVPVPTIHYSYKVGERMLRQAIRYMSKPTDNEMINHIDFDLKRLLCLDLKGMHFVRFWGTSANSEYRKNKDKNETTSPAFEVDGIGYKLVGIITQHEFDTETAGKSLSRTPGGLIIVLEDVPKT